MKLLAFAMALSAFPSSLAAQQGNSPRVPSRPSGTPAAPFDTSTPRLTSAALRTGLALIGEYKVEPRGEFETSAAYAARRGRARTTPVALRFRGEHCQPSFSYNADRGVMTMSVETDLDFYFDAYVFVADCQLTESGGGQRSNAFGATVHVRNIDAQLYGVRTPFQGGLYTRDSILEWAMPLADAQAAKPHLRAALVAWPIIPDTGNPVDFEWKRSTPTVRYPTDLNIHFHIVTASRIELWVYDSRSGRVLAKSTPFGEPFRSLRPR